MELLQKYYEGKIQSLSEGEEQEISNVEDGVGIGFSCHIIILSCSIM